MALNICIPLSRPDNLKAVLDSIFASAVLVPESNIGYINIHIVIDKKIQNNENVIGIKKVVDNCFSSYKEKNEKVYNFILFYIFEAISDVNIAGHSSRNECLNYIRQHFNRDNDHFFYSLDDDNILYPLFLPTFFSLDLNNIDGFICSQMNKDGSLRLRADKNNVRVGLIDTAMYAFKIKPTNGLLFETENYCADGVFIEKIFNPNTFIVTETILSFYNYLRP